MEENKKPEFVVDIDEITARSESLKNDLDSIKEYHKPTDEEVALLIERIAKLRGMTSEEYYNQLKRIFDKAKADQQQYYATHGTPAPEVYRFIDDSKRVIAEAQQDSFTRH